MSELDKQVAGEHYKKYGDFQPVAVLQKWMSTEEFKGYVKGQVIAYLARESDKNGRVDIEKAHHWLGLYLELTAESPSQETKMNDLNDGWIEWNGGECPVNGDTDVTVTLRNGYVGPSKASLLDWVTLGGGAIIKYRIHKEDK